MINNLQFLEKYIPKNKMIKIIYILLGIQIGLGLIWTAYNFNDTPVYGDTPEYMNLSKTFQLDTKRTILYPVLINILSRISQIMPLEIKSMIYLVQITISLFSFYYFFYYFLKMLKPDQDMVNNRKLILLLSFFCFTNPLILHLNLSVLTDSLALSFTFIFLTTLMRLFNEKPTMGIYIVVFLSFVAMSLLRAEKLYVGALTLLFCILIRVLVSYKTGLKNVLKSNYKALLVLFLATMSVIFINSSTQTVNSDRPPMTVSYSLFTRIVWPRLEKVYYKLPEDIRRDISYQDAVYFDQQSSHVREILMKLTKGNWVESKEKVNIITKITFQNQFPAIIFNIIFDIIKFFFSPFLFIAELLFKLLGVSEWNFSYWTYSRMSMFHPILTGILFMYSTVFFALVQIPLLYLLKHRKDILLSMFPFIVGSIVNSVLFAFNTGSPAHIRYALPSYSAFILISISTLVILQLGLDESKISRPSDGINIRRLFEKT